MLEVNNKSKNTKKQITIGTDPEVMVMNQLGQIVPVCGLLGGTKDKPIETITGLGMYQEDNVNAEFNTVPAKTSKEFINAIENTMECLVDALNAKGTCYTIEVKSSHNYTRSELKAAGSQAMTFGCDPDFNALTGKTNSTPSPYTLLRTCGGHVHIGWTDNEPQHSKKQRDVVKMCDYVLGLWSVTCDPDTTRRSMYGAAGAYRPKEYGVEYRTLSNFWINSEHSMYIVFQYAKWCAENTDKLKAMNAIISYKDLQEVINSSDQDQARKLFKEVMEVMNGLL